MRDARHHLEMLYWLEMAIRRVMREALTAREPLRFDTEMRYFQRLLARALEEARDFLETEKSAPQTTIFDVDDRCTLCGSRR
jgi:hypothetical protein